MSFCVYYVKKQIKKYNNMKKLLLISALLPIASVSLAYGSVNSILESVVPIVIPIALFICGTIVAIAVTSVIVNANARTKQAKYDMMKKFAETGAQLPKEFQAEIKEEVSKNSFKTKSDTGIQTAMIIFVVVGVFMLLNVRSFSYDLAEFVIGFIFLFCAAACAYISFKTKIASEAKSSIDKNSENGCHHQEQNHNNENGHQYNQ